jgi:hypothetical protein
LEKVRRKTYRELREEAIHYSYHYAHSVIRQSQISGIESIQGVPIFGAFFDETYECGETDLDELMMRTFELIVFMGIGSEIARNECSRIVKNILSRNSFHDLVADIPADEADELRYDLKLLGFLDDHENVVRL